MATKWMQWFSHWLNLPFSQGDRQSHFAELLEQQRASEALRESQAYLLALIENTQDAVWSVDTSYTIVTINSAFKEHFLAAYGVELQKGMNMIQCLPAELQAIWQGYYSRALQGERFAIEQHYALAESLVEIEVSFNPILTESGEITGVSMFGRNITDRKQARRALQQARDQLQAVLDAVPGCVSWFSADLTYLGINRYLATLFQARPEDFDGRKLGFLEGQNNEFTQFVRDFFASPATESSIELDSLVNGATRNFLMVAQKYNQDQAAVFVGIDITERKQTEEALRESEERYALAVKGATDGLWDWNLKTNEIYFSPRWKSMLGFDDEEISDGPEEWFNRVHSQDMEQLKMAISVHLKGLTPHFEQEYRIFCKNQSYRWMLSRGLAVRDPSGRAYRMTGSQTDITDRKLAEEQLLHDALHDALTGLPNRVLFIDRLRHAIALTKRDRDYLFAVLFVDLDRFKVVNDSLGHLLGDQLLIAIARKLEKSLRPGDTVARLGGDEFTILVEDLKEIGDATRLAAQLQQELALPFDLSGHEVFTNVSIGIALSTGYDRPEDLLRDADTALYRAKALGKGRYEVFDRSMHIHAVALLHLETDLRRAVERQEFQLYYQPIITIETNQIRGFEALIRWQHPQRGLVSPDEFVPIIEETGLIVPIGQWVLREACRQMRAWQTQFVHEPPLLISVNLSGKQFQQLDLIAQISQVLQETGLAPSDLKLEITESVIMDNAESAAIMLRQLQALGIRLAIDDFGTGYSSLAYLHRFPIDTLKIDRSFINAVDVDVEKLEIVRSIISLAWNLGMDVIAEGVETTKQLAQLKALGCDYGQGYLFAKPLTTAAAANLLTSDLLTS